MHCFKSHRPLFVRCLRSFLFLCAMCPAFVGPLAEAPLLSETAPSSGSEAGQAGGPGEEATRSDAAGEQPEILTVKFAVGNVREEPTTQSAVIGKVEHPQKARLLERRGDWCKVELPDGKTGWAHRSIFHEPPERVAPQRAKEQTPARNTIKGIRADVSGRDEEKVLFLLEGFFPPQAFVIEKGSPRIVCDFAGARLASGIEQLIPVNGSMILRVRTWEHSGDQPKVRSVVDLASGKSYEVDQVFFKEQNVYAVIVRSK